MSQRKRLLIVLLLNLALVLGLAVVGLVAGSVSLLSAGADCAADVGALALGLYAVRQRDRHGRPGAINVVALVNVVVLLVLTGAVWVESGLRLLHGAPAVAGGPMVVAAVVETAVLALGVLVLGRGAGREDLHMRSVLLDTAADCLTAAAVAVVGVVIALTHGLYWLDPVAAALIGAIVAVGAIRLLVDVLGAMRSGVAVEVDRD